MLAVVALALNAGVTLAQDKEKKDKHEGHEVPGVVKEAIARYYTDTKLKKPLRLIAVEQLPSRRKWRRVNKHLI